MKQFFLQIYTNRPCSSSTIHSQFPFKYDICVFIAYVLFQVSPMIDGFHSDVMKCWSQNSEVLRILIYTRLKINKSKSLYKFPFL